MSIGSSLVDWVKAVVGTIFRELVRFLKKFWPLILLIAVIYFAPIIAAWLLSSGAPSWLVTAFAWVGTTVNPLAMGLLGSVWSGVAGIGGAAWSWFRAAELGTQLVVLGMAGTLLAPEETGDLITEVGEVVGDVATSTIDSVIDAVTKAEVLGVPILYWAIGGVLAYFLLTRKKQEQTRIVVADTKEAGYGDDVLQLSRS